MQKYLKRNNSAAIFSLLLVTGCASHADDAKLQADMVILTQKMQALNTELIALKAKQAKEQQLKDQQSQIAQ
jgi:outer membrane murein-binding lipoprotein Lpp